MKSHPQLRCVIVDDDPFSRQILSRCISRCDKLRLAGTFSSAREAATVLAAKDLDLVFLDVEMPEMTGFELLQNYHDIPQVIVVTSKEEYSFEAFRYDITDFLLKPISIERFEKAVDLAWDYTINVIRNKGRALTIRNGGVKKKISLDQIDYIEAMGDYLKVITDTEIILVKNNLKTFMCKLPKGFLRIHRSFIVNVDKILELDDNQVVGSHFNLPVNHYLGSTARVNLR